MGKKRRKMMMRRIRREDKIRHKKEGDKVQGSAGRRYAVEEVRRWINEGIGYGRDYP